jgi:hypothetical protein
VIGLMLFFLHWLRARDEDRHSPVQM